MFSKKNKQLAYDSKLVTPVIRCSICTGEQVVGFKDNESGKFMEDMLINNDEDLEQFKRKYGIIESIEKIY